MEKSEILFISVFGGILLLLIIIKYIKYLIELFGEMNYVKSEIGRANSKGEYRHWKKRLKNLYLCLIPGITPQSLYYIKRMFKRKK